jgi:hypothetical protein
MNYRQHYDNLIASRKDRILDPFICYEKHHILPKCLGGTNDKENLVLLTAREHFICHWILVRIHTNNSKLIYSFHAMCTQNKTGERYTPSSRTYAEAKELFKKNFIPWNKGKRGIVKNVNAGKTLIELFGTEKAADINCRKSKTLKETHSRLETKEKMFKRKPRNTYTMSAEVKAKISATLKNRYLNGDIQNGMTGKKHSNSTKQLIRDRRLKLTNNEE